MLCSVCNCIDVDELIPPESSLEAGILSGTRHHASFTDLEAAAKAGCEFCAAIKKCAQDLVTQPALLRRLRNYPVDLKMQLKGHTNPGYQGACRLWASCQGRIIAQLDAYVPRDSKLANPELKLISGRPISSDPTSDACFAVANNWINECMTSNIHDFCPRKGEGTISRGPLKPESPLPTRLIDVGPADGSQEPALILSSDIKTGESWNYAALSHCWGGAQLLQIGIAVHAPDTVQTLAPREPVHSIPIPKPLTTLTSNFKDRMKGIPMKILPRTFQDSVKITRGLGLRYIWIDSLCIIQDSKSDWEQEAARMADIYKNSYITIAAESSPDSHQGILRERVPSFRSIELPFNSSLHDIHTTMFIRPALDSWELSLTSPKSKLCSRAWVLQESLLAPRTIHFGEQQMLWECRSRSLAEGDMTPIPPSTREKMWSWSQNKRFLANVESGASDMGGSMKYKGLALHDISYLQWYSIIRDYSSRNMTFSSDVFPALVGIATEFNARLGDQYCAGLWRGDLHRGLFWTVDDPERAKVATPYRAPSWSWASIVGQIGHSSGLNECLHMVRGCRAEILQVETKPASDSTLSRNGNYYSEISSGILKLRGRWKSTRQWSSFEDEYYQTHIIPGTEERMGVMFRYFDCGTEERCLERRDNGRELSLLHIANWIASVGDSPVAHFLILESGDSGDESFYRRVGVVVLHNTVDFEKWIEEWEMREVTLL